MIDQNKDELRDFAEKEYRDEFMATQTQIGIAVQIRAMRRKFDLTQAEMAEKTGKTQSVISRLSSTEYGKVTVQTLLDIASGLDVALLVQFVSYPDFLKRTADMSDKAQPETIHESLSASSIVDRSADHPRLIEGKRMHAGTNRPLEPPTVRAPSAADAHNREDLAGGYSLTSPHPSLAASAAFISAKPSFQSGLVQ